MEKNKAYWKERAILREEENNKRTVEQLEMLFRRYERAGREIRNEVDSFILRYGGKYGLTYDQAAKLLSRRELQEWEKTLGEYVEEIKSQTDPKLKRLLTARLNALSANSSITRLDALLGQINGILNRLWTEATETMYQEFGDAFQEGYYKKTYDLQCRAGYIYEFAYIDEKTLEDVLSYPWSGAVFSDRIWRNRDVLAFQMQEALTQGIIQGKSSMELSKALSEEMGKSFKTAERLVRTEMAWIHGEADKRAYAAAGSETYEFMATLDFRTSSICAGLDGKIFPVKDAKVGENYPPMHPFCRSTTVESDPEEWKDWAASGKPMPKNMTYEEWYDEQVAQNGAGFVERQRKKEYNKTKDKAQFERYLDILGEEFPQEFDSFQRMKYHDENQWEYFKSLVKSKNYLQQKFSYVWNGEKLFIPKHTKFDNVITMAGAGTDKEIRVVDRLVESYGGSREKWMKRAGKVSSDKYIFDLHWYECDDGIQREVKIKDRRETK